MAKGAAGTFECFVRLSAADRDAAKASLPAILEHWPKDVPYVARVMEQNSDVKREDGAVAKNRVETFASSDPAFVAKEFDEDAPLMYRPLVVQVVDAEVLEAEEAVEK